jgi:hypothetical protein
LNHFAGNLCYDDERKSCRDGGTIEIGREPYLGLGLGLDLGGKMSMIDERKHVMKMMVLRKKKRRILMTTSPWSWSSHNHILV